MGKEQGGMPVCISNHNWGSVLGYLWEVQIDEFLLELFLTREFQ